MTLHRTLAVLFLAASLSGGVLAQGRISIDDETIFIAVDDALRGARSLAGADITVRSRDGVVTLSGFAGTMEDVDTAVRLAARVRGVTAVNSEIRIAIRPPRA